MRLTPWEEERLLIFSAAELARRHRAAGIPLNHPEAVALICDAMLETARAGGGYAEVEAAGRSAVTEAELMVGVRNLLDEVRLEVLLGDGTRLVVLLDPLGPVDPLGVTAPTGPPAVGRPEDRG
jgi:urease gamma subunit